MAHGSTTTDAAGGDAWLAADVVVRLREWGTERTHAMPEGAEREWTIGADAACWLRLEDASKRLSRRHARLVRDAAGWTVEDLGSKNGIRLDGAKRAVFPLVPGAEVGIGGATLVAESPRLIAVRAFVCRLLGWGAAQGTTVDLAVRAIRSTSIRREPLVLRGEGELVAIAQQLHRRTLGDERPFVLCDPRRRKAAASVRAAANRAEGVAALRAAHGGTLCVWAKRLPHDFDAVLAALREPGAQAQLVVCALADDKPNIPAAVVIPDLAQRADEIDRIIVEYAADALADLEAKSTSFQPGDREWVRAHFAASLADIEKATRRLVALREHRNVHRAATRLGMSHVSLAEWIGRRPLPAGIATKP